MKNLNAWIIKVLIVGVGLAVMIAMASVLLAGWHMVMGGIGKH